MKTITKHIRSNILKDVKNKITLSDLKLSEWSNEFEQLMRNRLIMGALRYGKLGGEDKKDYDRIEGVKKHLNLYEETGNTEHLVDIANIVLCEFVEGKHPNKHFKSNDDSWHMEEK